MEGINLDEVLFPFFIKTTTLTPTFFDELQQLISKGHLEKVIALLQDGDHWIPESARKEMSLLSEQLRQFRQQEVRGMILNKKASVQKKEIEKAFLLFIETHFRSPKEKVNAILQNKIKWLIFLGLGLIMLGMMIWMLISR